MQKQSFAPSLGVDELVRSDPDGGTARRRTHRLGSSAAMTVVELFERQVRARPEAIAVTDGDHHMSYRDLEGESAAVAREVVVRDHPPSTPVGLLVDRSARAVTGILGILRAGRAYLPLDVHQPPDRSRMMLDDAGVRSIVTTSDLTSVVAGLGRDAISVDAIGPSPDIPLPPVHPGQLAYVIYTSGSTGRPKGVMVEHRHLERLLKCSDELFDFGPDDVWTLFHSHAFDVSVWEMWGALTRGGRLVVVPYWTSRSPELFRALLHEQRVTVLSQTPSAFLPLMDVELEHGSGDDLALRYVIFAGEALNFRSLAPWFKARGDQQPLLINMYGTTETTVHATFRTVTMDDMSAGASLVGRPLPHLQIHLLDDEGRPVPDGEAGEIHIAGAGVTRGYLGRPDLTERAFLWNHLGPGRMYRTGDVGRRTPDGDLEYLGRRDDQIKVRGHRVEPGEIEARLASHPLVARCSVLPRTDATGATSLAAFVVPDPDQAAGLRQVLRFELDTDGDARLHELDDGVTVYEHDRSETEFVWSELRELSDLAPEALPQPGDQCVVDVGANIGLFTVLAGHLAPGCRVHAFEPVAQLTDILRDNARLHGVDVTVHVEALGDEEGSVDITYYPGVSILSGAHAVRERDRDLLVAFERSRRPDASPGDLGTAVDFALSDAQRARVPARRLSSVLSSERIDKIDLLKIDVERAELDVLRGIDSDDWSRIRRIVVESDEPAACEVQAVLESKGFDVRVVALPLLAATSLVSLVATRPGDVGITPAPISGCNGRRQLARILRDDAERHLPAYMVPASFTPVLDMPLNQSGKLDRPALISLLDRPSMRRGPCSPNGEAPSDELERALCELWSEALEDVTVGPHDDVFLLGAHSITTAEVASGLKRRGYSVPLAVLYEHRSPAAAAAEVRKIAATQGS